MASALGAAGTAQRRRGVGIEPDDRGRLSYRRQLPADAARAPRSRCPGPLVDAELEMRTLTQKGEFSFTPRVRATYFPDESDLDSVDYFATLDGSTTASASRTRFRGDFAQQDVVNSEQPDADIDTGLGEPVIRRRGPCAGHQPAHALRPAARRRARDLAAQRRSSSKPATPTSASTSRSASAQVGFDVSELAAAIRTRINERTHARHAPARRRSTTSRSRAMSPPRMALELQWDTRTVEGHAHASSASARRTSSCPAASRRWPGSPAPA